MFLQTLANGIEVETEQEFPLVNNEVVKVVVPWSEVCMHMKVAGTVMYVALKANGERFYAQLETLDGVDYSFPITTGEAGFYYDAERKAYYCYKVVKIRQADDRTCPACGERDNQRFHGIYSSRTECRQCGQTWNAVDVNGRSVEA